MSLSFANQSIHIASASIAGALDAQRLLLSMNWIGINIVTVREAIAELSKYPMDEEAPGAVLFRGTGEIQVFRLGRVRMELRAQSPELFHIGSDATFFVDDEPLAIGLLTKVTIFVEKRKAISLQFEVAAMSEKVHQAIS